MDSLAGKMYSVLGLARSGVAAANYLVRHGARVVASDLKPADQLPLDKLDAAVEVRAGENYVREGDTVVISPGIKPGSPTDVMARARGAEVISDIELFYRQCPCPVVAITGTDGKSTTTALIGSLLEAAGLKVFVGGNIGNACMDGLEGLGPDDVAVLEISCFQLVNCHRLHPLVAVVTNIAEDHVEYHGSMEAYIEAKKRVFRTMGEGDLLVLNGEDPEIATWELPEGAEIVRWGWHSGMNAWSDRESVFFEADGLKVRIATLADLKLKGLHNVENIMAALLVLDGRFAPPSQILEALKEFPGLEHRMEFVANVDGIAFYNDSKATNPHAATAVLNAFDQRFIMLAGGHEKGADYAELGKLIGERTSAAVCFGATGARLASALPSKHPSTVVDTLDQAVQAAYKMAGKGEMVILVPATSSFDQFADYEERGRVFKQLVHNLQDNNSTPSASEGPAKREMR